MKKLFTLLMMLSCIFVINAQVTESGNGFKETFSYAADMDFNDLFIEGVNEIGWIDELDWAQGAIEEGMIKFTLQPGEEGSIGWGFSPSFDLTGNSNVTFKYKFPEGTEWYFGAEDDAGNWADESTTSLILGTGELQEVSIDLTTLEGTLDLSTINGVWMLPTMGADAAAGTYYIDDVVIGDAMLSGITESGNGFREFFDYAPDQDFNDLFIEGVNEIGWIDELDYAQGAIEDGMLKFTLEPGVEGSVGWGFSPAFDLTGNSNVTFKYKFPAGIEWYFGAEDDAGNWADESSTSLTLGTDDLQEVTIDLTTLEGELDLTKINGVWMLPTMGADAAAGTLYFDDIVIGDAGLSSGININKVSLDSNLKIYPNPARTHISIGVDAASVSIYNTVGQEVYSTINYLKETPINVEELNSGMYIIKADSSTQKLIIR